MKKILFPCDKMGCNPTKPFFFQRVLMTLGKFLGNNVKWKKNDTNTINIYRFTHTQLFSHSVMFDSATPWSAAHQASLSFTISGSLLKLMSIETVMPSNHLILCRSHLLLPSIFPSIRVFSNNQLFASGGQSIGASASASVLPVNIQS